MEHERPVNISEPRLVVSEQRPHAQELVQLTAAWPTLRAWQRHIILDLIKFKGR